MNGVEAQCSQLRRDAEASAARISDAQAEAREARLGADEAKLALAAALSSAAVDRDAAAKQIAAQRTSEERLQEALQAAQQAALQAAQQAAQQAEVQAATAAAAAAERASLEQRQKAMGEELAAFRTKLKTVRHPAHLPPQCRNSFQDHPYAVRVTGDRGEERDRGSSRRGDGRAGGEAGQGAAAGGTRQGCMGAGKC